jgi:hypothetical protein
MKIKIETSAYNDRRYGRPYIAKIDFAESTKGEAQWGEWVGQNGCEGILVIDAEVGDILMKGQKDNRGSKSAPHYYQVVVGGDLTPLDSKARAYELWEITQKSKTAAPVPAEAKPQEITPALLAIAVQKAFLAAAGVESGFSLAAEQAALATGLAPEWAQAIAAGMEAARCIAAGQAK